MGTARFDDGTPNNPKLIEAGAAASWLWFCGVLYCRRALTDGFIPKLVVPTLVVGLANPYKHAARLVEVNLWHDAIGGYEIHDYLDWNPSKSAMTEYRKADRERKHKKHGIHSPSPSGIRTESERNPNDGANAGASHVGTKSESQSESKPVSVVVLEKSARETTAISRQGFGSSLIGNHRGCYFAPDACAAGMCVPSWLGAQWTQQYRGENERAETEIRAFITGALVGLQPGHDPKRFWPAAWAAKNGAQTPTVPMSGKGNASRDAMQRTLAKRAMARGEAL